MSGDTPLNPKSGSPEKYSAKDFIVALLLCIILVGFIVFVYMIVVGPKPTLHVTYELRSDDEKACPKCAEDIKKAAVVCRYCGHDFTGNNPSLAPLDETLVEQA